MLSALLHWLVPGVDSEEEGRDVGVELVEVKAELAGPEGGGAGEDDVDRGIDDAAEVGGQIAGVMKTEVGAVALREGKVKL